MRVYTRIDRIVRVIDSMTISMVVSSSQLKEDHPSFSVRSLWFSHFFLFLSSLRTEKGNQRRKRVSDRWQTHTKKGGGKRRKRRGNCLVSACMLSDDADGDS